MTIEKVVSGKHHREQAGTGLGLFALIALVVGSMLGGGVYSLPQNMAASSALGPIFISWAIAGFGIYFIANSFRMLSDERPDLQAGIYMYGREAFGPMMGFISAWGYWLMACLGNVAFAVILMEALDFWFPGTFTGGNTLAAVIGGSILIWGYYFVVLAGVKQASILNNIGTIAKVVPLLLFILILIWGFDFSKFEFNFWGSGAPATGSSSLGSLKDQISAPMLVTLWAFIGVEGAVVLSGRARDKKSIGRATLIGFLIALIIYTLLSVMPWGHLDQPTLEKLANPSTAGVLDAVVGDWGAWLMNLGLVVSVLAGWLAWTLLLTEIPFVAGKNGTFPKSFAKSNKNGVGTISLLASSMVMQAAMILVYFSDNAWHTMLSVTTVMVLPAYLCSVLFMIMVGRKMTGEGRRMGIASGVIGTIFCLYMFYAGNLKFVALVPVLLLAGIPVFMRARRDSGDGKPLFQGKEPIYLGVLVALVIGVVFLFATGAEKLSSI
ncbi:MAG TPA: basic amino acid/polyamine antiporter [Solirubrobacterales bacterium]|nr:basic amino acid/polyamine antiporter [Solirubrobacterales bacterium]